MIRSKGERKTTAWSFFHWQIKSNWGIALATIVLEFFLVALPVFLDYGSRINQENWWDLLRATAIPIAWLMILIQGHRLYFYLHDQEEAKQVFSLPISRRSLFAQSYLSGIFLLLIPRVISILWATPVFYLHSRELGGGNLFTSFIYTSLQNGLVFLFLLCIWAMLSLFHILCGRKGQAEWITILINILWPSMIVLFSQLALGMLPGMPDQLFYATSKGWELIYSLLAPFFAPFAFGNWHQANFFHLVYWSAFFILFSFLCFLLFKRRPTEKSGSDLDQEKVFIPLRLLFSITAAVGLAMIFTHLRYFATDKFEDLLPATIAGLVIGSVLSSLIFDLVLERGKRDLFKSLSRALISWIPLAIVMTVLMTGFFSYSEKFPSKQNTKELKISGIQNKQIQVSYTDPRLIESISQAIQKNFPKENPGLALPRHPLSRAQFQDYNFNANRYFLMDARVTWEEKGRAYSREFFWRINGCTPALNQMLSDPAFQIVKFLEYSPWSLNEVNSFEHAIAKGRFEAKEGAKLPSWIQSFTMKNDIVEEGLGASILLAFHQDYSKLSDQERLALNREAPYFLHFQTDFKREYDVGLFLSPNGEEGEILLPFNDQFTELQKYCEEATLRPRKFMERVVPVERVIESSDTEEAETTASVSEENESQKVETESTSD